MIINTLIFVLLNSIFCFVFMKEKIESCSTTSEKRRTGSTPTRRFRVAESATTIIIV